MHPSWEWGGRCGGEGPVTDTSCMPGAGRGGECRAPKRAERGLGGTKGGKACRDAPHATAPPRTHQSAQGHSEDGHRSSWKSDCGAGNMLRIFISGTVVAYLLVLDPLKVGATDLNVAATLAFATS